MNLTTHYRLTRKLPKTVCSDFVANLNNPGHRLAATPGISQLITMEREGAPLPGEHQSLIWLPVEAN
ncbi:hypothetical protein TNCT_186671 [Trichonephila clavata]|uniref:Uncharacterized protein n=1 Tax=Trichonephila clavata TaxID=2740835 RepID=A0A8X6L441_TRICU|nr:hypothetical protein TNCT_186671 [Trichonephila clavata]